MRTHVTDADGVPRVAQLRKNDVGTYDARCSCGFQTSEWPKRKLAEARMEEHLVEHETAEAMRELHAFREEHGLNGGPPPAPTINWED